MTLIWPPAGLSLGTERGEASFRRLFEAAPGALLVVTPEGRISLANSAAAQLFGHTRSTLIGQSIEVLAPAPRWNELAPPLLSMDAGRELRALRRDGTELVVGVSLSAVQCQHGTVLALKCDTTGFERTEDEHRRELEEARQLPASLAAELCAAAHVADYDRLMTLVAQVATDHPVAAEALQEFVDQYRYDEIEALLRT